MLSSLLLAASLAALPAPSIVPALDVAALAASADVIVLGTADGFTDVGPIRTTLPNGTELFDGRVMRADVHVTEFLKGSGRTDFSVEWVRIERSPIFLGLRRGHQVIFLTCQIGRCGFASPYHPSLIAAPVPAGRPSGTMVDRVAARVGAVLRDPGATPQDRGEAAWVLMQIHGPEAVRQLKRAAADRDVAVRLTAVAGLLWAGDGSELALVEEALRDGSPSAVAAPDEAGNLRAALAGGLKEGDDRAVAVAGRLMASESTATRLAAAEALARSRSAKAIPALVKALDDPDAAIRYTAALGLARIAGDRERTMSRDAFDANAAAVIDYWKAWARQRGIVR